MPIQKPIRLNITEADLDPSQVAVKKEVLKTRTLGSEGNETAERKILDMLPTIISRRVEQIIPPDFELAELELKFEIEGKIFGTGLSGEVVATLKKKAA